MQPQDLTGKKKSEMVRRRRFGHGKNSVRTYDPTSQSEKMRRRRGRYGLIREGVSACARSGPHVIDPTATRSPKVHPLSL
jgi:hypothetical protein